VATGTDIRILDLNGAPLVAIPFTHPIDGLASINAGITSAGDRIFVEYVSAIRNPNHRRETPPPSFLDEVDFSGKVVRSYHLVEAEPFEDYAAEPGWLHTVTASLAPILPFAPFVDSSFSAFSFHDPLARPGLIALGVGIIAAVCAFVWGRKVGFSRSKASAWAAFAFLFGLPSLITFRLASGWPTQVACPSCSHRRPIETEECPSCHQAWPRPKSNGTEIFADLSC